MCRRLEPRHFGCFLPLRTCRLWPAREGAFLSRNACAAPALHNLPAVADTPAGVFRTLCAVCSLFLDLLVLTCIFHPALSTQFVRSPVYVLSRFPQIYNNYVNGGTGELNITSYVINFLVRCGAPVGDTAPSGPEPATCFTLVCAWCMRVLCNVSGAGLGREDLHDFEASWLGCSAAAQFRPLHCFESRARVSDFALSTKTDGRWRSGTQTLSKV